MKFGLILLIINATQAKKICKNIVEFDGKNYEKEYLLDEGVSKPFYLRYIEKSNEFLFHTDADPIGNTETYIINLGTKELTPVDTVKNAVGSVVDDKGTIYITQEGGIFKFDDKTKEVTPTGVKDVVFYTVQNHDGKIYFTDFPAKDLFIFDGEKAKPFITGLGIVDFEYDSNDNFYYFNKTGPYVQKKGESEVKELSSFSYDDVPLIKLIHNKENDKIYATSIYGVFVYDIKDMKLKRISLKYMLDIAFDKDNNFYYSDEESIVKLKPTDKSC